MKTLIFDTETARMGEEVIEAAWLELDTTTLSSIKVVDEFCERYKPAGAIDFGAMATHHIIPEDLVDCPPSASFTLPEHTQYLIGHNIDYDWKVLGCPNIRRICTLALARHVWPNIDHKQSALAYFLMDDKAKARDFVKGAHNALADVRICLFILEKIIKELGITNIEELYEASERARIPTIMPFGKHKGVEIAKVPNDWVTWYKKQDEKDPYLVKAFELAKAKKLANIEQDVIPF